MRPWTCGRPASPGKGGTSSAVVDVTFMIVPRFAASNPTGIEHRVRHVEVARDVGPKHAIDFVDSKLREGTWCADG